MSFFLKELIIYARAGDVRKLRFHEGLNIITGASKTGKSAIIDIVDYCTGRGECFIAEGVIRRSASWFALLLSKGDEELFIARRNPGPGVRTSGDIFIMPGANLTIPTVSNLVPNITRDALVSLLTRFCGINENEFRPTFGTRRPLQATIKHAKLFNFQKQYEIANQYLLFHRQGEDFIPQAIKDTFPYFLGAVDERQFLKQHLLDTAQDELRRLETQLAQESLSRNALASRVRGLVSEAKRAGLIEEGFEPIDPDVAIARLDAVSQIAAGATGYIPDFGDTIERIRNEQNTLADRLEDTKQEIRATRLFLSDQG